MTSVGDVHGGTMVQAASGKQGRRSASAGNAFGEELKGVGRGRHRANSAEASAQDVPPAKAGLHAHLASRVAKDATHSADHYEQDTPAETDDGDDEIAAATPIVPTPVRPDLRLAEVLDARRSITAPAATDPGQLGSPSASGPVAAGAETEQLDAGTGNEHAPSAKPRSASAPFNAKLAHPGAPDTAPRQGAAGLASALPPTASASADAAPAVRQMTPTPANPRDPSQLQPAALVRTTVNIVPLAVTLRPARLNETTPTARVTSVRSHFAPRTADFADRTDDTAAVGPDHGKPHLPHPAHGSDGQGSAGRPHGEGHAAYAATAGTAPANDVPASGALPAPAIQTLVRSITDAAATIPASARTDTVMTAGFTPSSSMPAREIALAVDLADLGVVNVHITSVGGTLNVRLAANHGDTARRLHDDRDALAQALAKTGFDASVTTAPAAPKPDAPSTQFSSGSGASPATGDQKSGSDAPWGERPRNGGEGGEGDEIRNSGDRRAGGLYV